MIRHLKNIFSSASEEELGEEFKVYYDAHSRFIRMSIYWMVRSDRIDDLVQETFLKAWKAFHQFERKSNFKTWIYRIAMNCTYDYLKKESKYVNSDESFEEGASDSNDLKDLISKALKELPLKQREVFVLYYKFEYKINDIADLLKIAPGTVKSRLSISKKIFKDYIEANGGRYE